MRSKPLIRAVWAFRTRFISAKGVGQIYQQTYMDTFCRVAHTKLYTGKASITATDLLRSSPAFQRGTRPAGTTCY